MSVANFLALLGSIAVLLSVVGLLRLRDQNRQRKTGLVLGLPGIVMTVAGLLILHPDWWARLLLISAVTMLLYPLHRALERSRDPKRSRDSKSS